MAKPVADRQTPSSEQSVQCVFLCHRHHAMHVLGLDGDSTIRANKAAIKNLALDDGLNAQGYFSYDSQGDGGHNFAFAMWQGAHPGPLHDQFRSG